MLSRITNVCGNILDCLKNWAVQLDNSGGPLVTYSILTICTFIHLYGDGWVFSLSTLSTQPFAIIGYQFTHANLGHLFSNALFLLFIGPTCEKYLGHTKFLLLFLVSGILSALGFTLVMSNAQVVGASGAISGLLAIFPFVQKRFYEIIGASVICTLYFWLQVLAAIRDVQLPFFATTAHLAHVLGGVVGLGMFAYFFRRE